MSTAPLNLHLIAGARPNFMKIAPLMEALRRRPERFAPFLVHTDQHYDAALSKVFFDDLRIPRPDVHLGVGSGSHAQQTAEVMRRYEPLVLEKKPDAVVVVGDVNSTIACALVAAKLGVKVIHVEAGLRSFDRSMPEEVNRVLVDAISDLLFVSEPAGVENLEREGVPKDRVHLVGNVMIDTLLAHRDRARESTVRRDLGVDGRDYAVLTLHRPSNVDDPATLGRLLDALGEIGAALPIVFPVHPRTLERIGRFGLREKLDGTPGLRPVSPLGYLDFLQLEAEARLVLTDSGGIQEETTALGVPCVTLRENTERPITIACGTNVLAGSDPARIVDAARRALGLSGERQPVPAARPALWDGKAAERIVDAIDLAFGGAALLATQPQTLTAQGSPTQRKRRRSESGRAWMRSA